MPKHYYAYETWDEFKSKLREPVGSGIMKFVTYETGQYAEMETFEDYYKGPAKIDGVIIRMIPDETQPAAVASGEVDLANPAANIETYETMIDTGIADVQEFLDNSYRYVGFNLRKDKFADKRVRQALAYGIRMDDYIENEWEGFAQAADSPISPISWAAPDQSTLNKYDYNPEKALELFAEAGWEKNDEGKLMKDGEQFVVEWTTYSEAEWPLNLIAVAENNWGELGIEVNANVMEFNAVVTQVFDEQDFDVWNMAWSLAIDPDPYAIFHSDNTNLGAFNAGGFENERADELIEAGRSTYDQEERAEIYAEWAQLANEELPYMFVSIGTRIWGVNNRVKNMEIGPYWAWTDALETVELDY
jgi:peptide/nickel transport system substrate-binding protein